VGAGARRTAAAHAPDNGARLRKPVGRSVGRASAAASEPAMHLNRRASTLAASLALPLMLAGCGSDEPDVAVVVPAAPVIAGLSLQLTRVGPEAVQLDWSFDPVAFDYLVSRDGFLLANVSANSLVDASVQFCVQHCYKIVGRDPAGFAVSETSVGCIAIV
jgi:hypothetical protein